MPPVRLRPLSEYREYTPEEMSSRARSFADELRRRRTVRHFSSREIPRSIIEECIRAAGSAPSGANLQPWHFVVVSDLETKRRIREAAEKEERAFYGGRATQEWLEALQPLGTDAEKPFLEDAPHLIVIFGERYRIAPDGSHRKNYYVTESVGIAAGLLVAAVHHAGLVSLTHTPSPMGFLSELLGRPENERPFLLLVVGYPEEDAQVPVIEKKELEEIATFVE